MKFCQTTRRLVATYARLGFAVALCLGVSVGAASAHAQGRSGGMRGGARGGMMEGRFAGPAPTVVRVPHVGLQLGLAGRWWDDGKTMKKLNLRADQQRRMDDIFEANKPALASLYANLQREEARLSSLPAGDLQDEGKVFAAIDRVSQARTELDKADAHILVQIRQQLDPPQLEALDREIANAR